MRKANTEKKQLRFKKTDYQTRLSLIALYSKFSKILKCSRICFFFSLSLLRKEYERILPTAFNQRKAKLKILQTMLFKKVWNFHHQFRIKAMNYFYSYSSSFSPLHSSLPAFSSPRFRREKGWQFNA